MPPKRQIRSDKLSQDIIDTICAAAHRRCQTSPSMKDEVRRHLGRGHWESARTLYRFETMDEFWAWFRTEYPATAIKIARLDSPEVAPRAFTDHLPWYLRNKGGDSCLYQSRVCRS